MTLSGPVNGFVMLSPLRRMFTIRTETSCVEGGSIYSAEKSAWEKTQSMGGARLAENQKITQFRLSEVRSRLQNRPQCCS
jgi:hypothetical protein